MVDRAKRSESNKENVDKKASLNQSSSTVPTISIPKGGGAIRGIGEKFGINPVTGTGSLSVPIFTSPGRSGFGPQLSISYDSGSGNGPFGFGWSLSLPSIARKTDKGLPRYQDADESDEFILSGAEDLVPVFVKDINGNWIHDQKGNLILDEEIRDGYKVRRYRSRIEGLFARIERWTREIDGDVHWRSISKDNILTVYGRNEESRIFDPADKSHIFSWLICESYDDKGNAIVYKYVAENEKGIDLSQANERNRLRTANLYLRRILYGNRKPLLLDITKPSFRKSHIEQIDFLTADWMFELVFDYGEDYYSLLPFDKNKLETEQHRLVQATASDTGTWPVRPDPFSSYRAGFEVRTYRRCHRVLMFHHFPELGKEPYLVRSTEFDYGVGLDYSKPVPIETELKHKGSTRFASFIQAITQSGYVRDETKPVLEQNGAKYLIYIKKSLPSLEFEYSKAIIQDKIEEIDAESLENLPYGIDGAVYQFVDLDGEGVSGILTEQVEAWFYKPNLGGGKFGPMEKVAIKPSLAALSGGQQQLLDLAGDGQLDIVMLDSPTPGFYERTCDQGWDSFTPFVSFPNLFWREPNLKFVDLTGDGHADIMITGEEVIIWHPSLDEEGFGQAERVRKALDEEKGPRLVFDDGTQSIYLADMSGDGLVDLVRIKNGEVCYWPNLGYGHFGAKVTMDNAPWFDSPDQFDQRRIRLADIDGSGTTDVIYLKHDGAEIYFNQSGNRFSDVRRLSSFPHIDNVSSIQVADLFGNGTACLVWSSPLACDSRRQMLYIDLMGGNKPHLLVSSKNNLGAETRVCYAASAKFYLEDKAEGKPWITRLPFPVHVVERVETYDRISRNLFVTRYAYHHGYFDGVEREFRGFGMIEQWDTEEIGNIGLGVIKQENTNWDTASFVPPVHTCTWFHTGAYLEGGRISKQFEKEYYREGDPSRKEGQLNQKQLGAMLLEDTILPDNLMPEEAREACRSLKGSILRQEVYALDRRPDGAPTEESDRPYTVSERNYTVKCLQPIERNKHAVFFAHPRETIDFHYERKLYKVGQNENRADPRVSHTLTIAVDNFGNVLQSAAISYGRRFDDPDKSLNDDDRRKQKPLLNEKSLAMATYIENSYTEPINDPIKSSNPSNRSDAYRIPMLSETRTYELLNMTPDANENLVTNLFRFDEISDKINGTSDGKIKGVRDGNHDIPYEDIGATSAKTGDPYRRLIEHVRTVYRSNRLDQLLPLGETESLALPGETYKLAFTKGLLDAVYQRQLKGQSPEKLLPDPSAVLGGKGPDGGGYVLDKNGDWWIPSGQIFYWDWGTLAYTAAQELDFASKHFFLPHLFRDPFGNTTIVVYDSSKTDPLRNHNLLLIKTSDPLYNAVSAQNNYRVLQPEKITDPNGSISEVLFNAFGFVVATAIHKDSIGDSLEVTGANLTLKEINDFFDDPTSHSKTLLGTNSTYIVYDIDSYRLSHNVDKPPYAASIARETHASDLVPKEKLKVQINFSYSDGFGREIQKKIQAEPGPVEGIGDNIDPRWVGSGWTIFNNKGKPVQKYEPFFDNTHEFKFEKKFGVSAILFYDPVERIVTTLHPNHTYEKVIFDPWHQQTFDVNDTVALDPRTDEDISGYVAGYFKQEVPQPDNWKTWLQQRDVYPLKPPEDKSGLDPEKKAAVRTLIHANTPTVDYFDSLGRTFLTVAHNQFRRRTNGGFEEVAQKHRTRIKFDIEGNQREIRDERKKNPDLPEDPQNLEERIVMLYDFHDLQTDAYAPGYDLLGNRIHQFSMEAGERWILSDVTGKPIRTWNSLANDLATAYDALRRPIEVRLQIAAEEPILVELTIYGESFPNPEANNLRGKACRVFDQAGTTTSDKYDFKGNLLQSKYQLARDYDKTINWSAIKQQLNTLPLNLSALDAAIKPLIEEETFTSSTTYDALNRPVEITAPHSNKLGTKTNLIRHIYNAANLLERVEANLQSNKAVTTFVKNIDYNAKGQRIKIVYGSGATEACQGVTTEYTYDPLTFRLVHLLTKRNVKVETSQEDCLAFPEDCPPTPPEGIPNEWPGCHIQNLHYTYDPIGNIINIRDDAQQKIFFSGKWVEPSAEYTYDAVYRLTEATGREHLGQAGNAPTPHLHDDSPRVGIVEPANDGKLMGRYFEYFTYDEAGNIKKVQHIDRSKSYKPGWTRTYNYNEDSLIEPGSPTQPSKKSNRLSSTAVGADVDPYKYDGHGNMTFMPHLANDPNKPDPNMHWDYKDQLYKIDTANGSPVYYTCDATGRRVRKVAEKSPGLREERIYLGGFEVFRKINATTGDVTLERDTLHIMDDKQRIALVETRTKGNDPAPEKLIRYQFGNHLGSVMLELDDKAEKITYEEYYPYGSTSYQAVRSQIETPKRYRYTSKERDEESGLYYNIARYYAPWLGRWTSYDPAGLRDGVTLYLYAINNPVGFKDIRGLEGNKPEIFIPTFRGQEGIKKANEVIENAFKSGLSPKGGPEAPQTLENLLESINVSSAKSGFVQSSQSVDVAIGFATGGGKRGGVVFEIHPEPQCIFVNSSPIASKVRLDYLEEKIVAHPGGVAPEQITRAYVISKGGKDIIRVVENPIAATARSPMPPPNKLPIKAGSARTIGAESAHVTIPTTRSPGSMVGPIIQAGSFAYSAYKARTAKTYSERENAKIELMIIMSGPMGLAAPLLMKLLTPLAEPFGRYMAEKAVESGANAPPRDPVGEGTSWLQGFGMPTPWSMGIF